MLTRDTLKKNPGMVMVATYVLLLVVNMLVLYFANLWFPTNVVLGTAHLTPFMGLLFASAKLALVGTFIIPFVTEYERMQKRTLSSRDWMVLYFFVNFATLWIIARFAEQLGLGLSSWVVAAVLAVVLDMAQGAAMMQLEKMRK